MADTKLPPEFDNFNLDIPVDIHDPSVNSLSNQNGLSDWQRFVVKNFFDTQPKRRNSYLKRLGYETSKDGEEYRPIGSDGNFQPIEPDNTFLGFIPYYNLFSEEGRKELQRDLKDIAFDTATGAMSIGPLAAAGASAGAAKGAVGGAALGAMAGPAGAAAGTTIGGVLGGLGGAAAGAIGGNVLAETLKAGIGDFFLDEQVPLDLQEAAYQSLVIGGLSALGKGGADVIKGLKKVKAEHLQGALKEAAVRKSNGTWNMELAQDLAKNPEKYTPEAVKGAQKKLLNLSDSIFGTSVENPRSTRQLTGGVARQAIEPLNDRADLEISKLAKNPEANFTVEEIIQTLKDRTREITNKKFKTQDEERAVSFFRDEIDRLKKSSAKAAPKVSTLIDPTTGKPFSSPVDEGFKELNFKEGRDVLKRWQNAAFEEGPVKDNRTVVSATRGLKELADTKAGIVGSDLPAINASRSEILSTHKNMQALIKDGTMQSAFVGKDSLAKTRVRRMFEEADRVLNTNLSKGAETAQFQAAVERLYDAPSAFGSGSVITDAMREGLRQAPKEAFRYGALGGAAGAALPGLSSAKVATTAAAVGAVKGFVQGAKEGASFSSPDTLLNSFSKVKVTLDALNNDPTVRQRIQQTLENPSVLGKAKGAFGVAKKAGVFSPAGQAGAQVDQLGPLTPPTSPEMNPQPATPNAGAQPPAAQPPVQAPPPLPPEFDDFQLTLPPGF